MGSELERGRFRVAILGRHRDSATASLRHGTHGVAEPKARRGAVRSSGTAKDAVHGRERPGPRSGRLPI